MRRYLASRISLLSSLSVASNFKVLVSLGIWLPSELHLNSLCSDTILCGTDLSCAVASTVSEFSSRTGPSSLFSGKLSSTSRYFTCTTSDFSKEVSDAEFFVAVKLSSEEKKSYFCTFLPRNLTETIEKLKFP
jgi:hypothetical protein